MVGTVLLQNCKLTSRFQCTYFLLFFFFFVYLAAYKHADGKKIDGRRVLVDVERGRTVKGWRPRRLGKSSFDQTCFDWI